MDQGRGVNHLARPSGRGSSSANHAPAASDHVEQLVERVIGMAAPDLRGVDSATATAVARRLGEMWLDDSCSFCDVTLGVHRLMRHHAAEAVAMPGGLGALAAPTMLLSPAPGDQHGFGCALVADALSRAGWMVTADVPAVAEALLAAAKREAFDVIGLSVGHDRAMEPTGRLVAALRRVSRNRQVRIALGGPMLNGRAAAAHALGADLHADDADGLLLALEPRTALAA